MYHLVDNLTNRSGDALVGYYVKLKDSAGNYATLYADANSTPIATVSGVADTAVTDDNGMYDLYVADGDYDVEVFDKNDISQLVYRIASKPMYGLQSSADLAAAVTAAETAQAGAEAAQAAVYGDLASTAAGKGAALSAYKRSETAASERTVLDALREQSIRVTEFGADPTTTNDSYAAIMAAIDAGIATGKEILFPQGQYKISQGIVVDVGRVHIRGEGRVVLQATFDGGTLVSFIGDDNGTPTIRYEGSFKNFMLLGNGSANQNGLHVKNFAHLAVSDISVRDIAGKGFLIESDVFSTYTRLKADQQSVGGTVFPTHALYLDEGDFGATTACYFIDCIFEEGTSYGVYLAADGASNCLFKGGGAEGLGGWGIYVGDGCYRNQFEQFYCEQNASGDFDILGDRNVFINCEAYNSTPGATDQFKIRSGATGNVIEQCGAFSSGGTALTQITIDSGAIATVVRDCDLHQLVNNGTRTVIDNVGDAFNGRTKAGAKSFGNTANGDTTLLDWYEESTFTPTFGGSTTNGTLTHDVQEGRFTRIGNRVMFNLVVRVSVVTGAPTGDLWVNGLPYTAKSGQDQSLAWGGGNLDLPGTPVGAAARVVAGTTSIALYGLQDDAAEQALDPAALAAGDIVHLSGTYEVA